MQLLTCCFAFAFASLAFVLAFNAFASCFAAAALAFSADGVVAASSAPATILCAAPFCVTAALALSASAALMVPSISARRFTRCAGREPRRAARACTRPGLPAVDATARGDMEATLARRRARPAAPGAVSRGSAAPHAVALARRRRSTFDASSNAGVLRPSAPSGDAATSAPAGVSVMPAVLRSGS